MQNTTELAEQLIAFFAGKRITKKQMSLLVYVAEGGTPSSAAPSIYPDDSAARKTFRNLHSRAVSSGFADGDDEVEVFRQSELIKAVEKPVGDKTRYYILSGCQDETAPHEGFLKNIKSYAAYLGDCEIMVSGATYNKSLFSGGHVKKSGKKTDEAVYHELLRPYLQNTQFRLCEGLLFCGEMNTLPTAVRPLSGFETYTDQDCGIFPHPKVQLESIPTAKNDRSKQLMTTGYMTLPNYVQKKAGIKASWHHIIGAVLVEVDADGNFFARQLQADTSAGHDGDFYDLDRHICDGSVTEGHAVEALNAGDIHHEKLDPDVALTTFGYDVASQSTVAADNLLDRFRPRHVFMHDLSDFSARNHHNIKDPHFLFQTHNTATANVEDELRGCAKFLSETRREFSQTVVVQSNHDNALLRWLKSVEWRDDMENARFYLRTQLAYLDALHSGQHNPPIFEDVLRGFGESASLGGVRFVAEDDSYLIAGGIECAMHGHLGANGARGNPKSFSRFGRKSNTGHTHSPAIFDGAYVAGVSATMDMGYNKGASSWAQAHILTYTNGKRCILTFMGGKWFAGQGEN